jgi:hypothetical protein
VYKSCLRAELVFKGSDSSKSCLWEREKEGQEHLAYLLKGQGLIIFRDIAFVHMDRVDNPDTLVLIADFFMEIAEIQCSIVSGVNKKPSRRFELVAL